MPIVSGNKAIWSQCSEKQ